VWYSNTTSGNINELEIMHRNWSLHCIVINLHFFLASPFSTPWRRIGERRYSSTHSLTSALDTGEHLHVWRLLIPEPIYFTNLVFSSLNLITLSEIPKLHGVEWRDVCECWICKALEISGQMAHPASYPTGTRGSFHGDKATGSWSWQLAPI